MEREDETIVRIVTIVTLGAIVVSAVAGLTLAAIFTDRDLSRPEAFTLIIVIILAALGGFTTASLHRRHRWRLEREDE